MKQVFKILSLSSLLTVCLISFQNCSKVTFSGEENLASNVKSGNTGDTNGGNDTNCRVNIINANKNVKVLFLIDTSGSNASNRGDSGTDPGKIWRLKTINSFISAYGSKPNFQFAFAQFAGTSASPILVNANNEGIFTNNSADISKAISDFTNIVDTGNTPYDAALRLLRTMIRDDQSNGTAKDAGYVVVMISDGTPTNTSYTESGGMNNLTEDVKRVLSEAAPGQISLNTVYLFNQAAPTASEKSYLQKISSLGSGAFIEASSNETIKILETVQVPSTVCE